MSSETCPGRANVTSLSENSIMTYENIIKTHVYSIYLHILFMHKDMHAYVCNVTVYSIYTLR